MLFTMKRYGIQKIGNNQQLNGGLTKYAELLNNSFEIVHILYALP